MSNDVPENFSNAVDLLRRHHYHEVAEWAESRRIEAALPTDAGDVQEVRADD